MLFKSYGKMARIGRYTWNVMSPLFGKYYVDIQSNFGSENNNIPESFDTFEDAKQFLLEIGYKIISPDDGKLATCRN